MAFEKEILDFLGSFSKDFLTSLESDVSDRVNRIIQTKIVKPIDLLGRRLMFGLTAAIAVSLGIVAIAASILIFLFKIIPWEVAFALVGVLLLAIGVVFSSKMASLKAS
ncbi:hypothetical protein ACFLRC_03665 [Candidatus Altiarchaeota archaeon]